MDRVRLAALQARPGPTLGVRVVGLEWRGQSATADTNLLSLGMCKSHVFHPVVSFAGGDCWTEVPNTHSLKGEVNSAASVEACQEACWKNASCDGVDWNPGLTEGQRCYLIGPWTTARQLSREGITQYLIDRNCGKSEYRTVYTIC